MKISSKLALISTLIFFVQGFAIGYFSTHIVPSNNRFIIEKIFFILFFCTMSYLSHRYLMAIITNKFNKTTNTTIHFKRRRGTNIIDLIPKKRKWFKSKKDD